MRQQSPSHSGDGQPGSRSRGPERRKCPAAGGERQAGTQGPPQGACRRQAGDTAV